MNDKSLATNTVETWNLPKPGQIMLVGRNSFRLSRLLRLGKKIDVSVEQVKLEEDPITVLGFDPKYIAIEKALAGKNNVQNNNGRNVLVAIDTLNGFIVSRNNETQVIYKGKPKSLSEVQDNLHLLVPIIDDYGIIQLEVAHAIYWSDQPDVSFVASTIHKGYIPEDKLRFLQNEAGFNLYLRTAAKYKLINPLWFSAGISWPTLYHMGMFDKVDDVSTTNSTAFVRKIGQVITHATSFDQDLLSVMLHIGTEGILGTKLTFKTYESLKNQSN